MWLGEGVVWTDVFLSNMRSAEYCHGEYWDGGKYGKSSISHQEEVDKHHSHDKTHVNA